MLFSSVEFLFVFLPATLAGYAVFAKLLSVRSGTLWLIAASLFFYAYWDATLLPLLLGSVVLNFICGKRLFAVRSRALLWMGLCFNIGLLAYFKYAGFFVENVEAAIGMEIANLNIVLPLAISFFTFQQIAYLVDVYQGKAVEPDFLSYVLFVSFFPQLISGPIVHHSEMMPQFANRKRRWMRRELILPALGFLIMGLYKKVVLADGIAPVADQVFDASNTVVPAMSDAWIGALAYTFQIYFDFSAYSDMAVGIALLFGIRLPLNFNSPYRAENIIDFWRRWHMTLSRFIRDYIYIPLGGNRKGGARRYTNLLIAMLIGGLWHGAGWTFIVWGGLHGAYLIVNHLFRRIFASPPKQTVWSAWSGRILTLLAVMIAWVFFRSDDFSSASYMLQGMFGLVAGEPVLSGMRTILWIGILLLIVWFLPNSWQVFHRFNPVLVDKFAETSLSDYDALPVSLIGSKAIMILLGLAMAIVSILVVIDRGSDTQRFIYMIF